MAKREGAPKASAKKEKGSATAGTQLGIEAELFKTADKLRGNRSPPTTSTWCWASFS